jgi:Uma2 family endonuclease
MSAAEPLGTMSYAEYLAFERDAEVKHEYVNGRVYAMAGGSTEHSRLQARLVAELTLALGDRPCEVFTSDLRVRVLETGLSTYPDVSVICGRIDRAIDDHHAATNPSLLAEVLSDGTEGRDRGEKWRHYQRIPSLQTYLLLSQTEPRVEVYRRAGDVWQYESAGPGERLRLDDHGLHLDVDALYRSKIAR